MKIKEINKLLKIILKPFTLFFKWIYKKIPFTIIKKHKDDFCFKNIIENIIKYLKEEFNNYEEELCIITEIFERIYFRFSNENFIWERMIRNKTGTFENRIVLVKSRGKNNEKYVLDDFEKFYIHIINYLQDIGFLSRGDNYLKINLKDRDFKDFINLLNKQIKKERK